MARDISKLTAKGEITKLEIVQEDNRPGAKKKEDKGEENPMLKALKESIEK